MFTPVRALVGLALLVVVAGCAPRLEPIVYVPPGAIAPDRLPAGKYGK